ncbi:MAG TPA: MarR family transcriptional regulator [Acidimicrobiales bacterium]|nr:MarR family transcriptional regulator [Acidimicrobiales bacterium]
MPGSTTASPDDQALLANALIRSSFLTMAVLSKQAAAHDISLTQLRVLGILQDRCLRMSELADYLGLDRSTISGLVDRLERRGLVERAPNAADGRSIDVRLTPVGSAAAERGADEINDALAPFLVDLSSAEARRLTALLEQVLQQGPHLTA